MVTHLQLYQASKLLTLANDKPACLQPMCSYSGCHVVLTAVLDCTKEVEKKKGQTGLWLLLKTMKVLSAQLANSMLLLKLHPWLPFIHSNQVSWPFGFHGPNPDVLITVHSTDGLSTLFLTYKNLLLPTSYPWVSSYFRFHKHVT